MAYDKSALITAFAHFARMLPTDYEPGQALEELVDAETTVLGLQGAGVVMRSQGRLRMVTSRGERVLGAERCQEHYQQGPCVDACRSGEVIVVGDLAQGGGRWPHYTAVARRDHIGAVAGIPMWLPHTGIGAVNLYQEHSRRWADQDLEVARVLADTAVGYVVNAGERRRHSAITGHLQTALDSRVLIEQAKGIIANAYDIAPDEAFTLIRGYARARRLRLREVAREIIESGLRI
ncbi:GAF and ANTAR domain-containing protein [Nocardia sp. NPDC004722]